MEATPKRETALWAKVLGVILLVAFVCALFQKNEPRAQPSANKKYDFSAKKDGGESTFDPNANGTAAGRAERSLWNAGEAAGRSKNAMPARRR
jgi:hypothetical protein